MLRTNTEENVTIKTLYRKIMDAKLRNKHVYKVKRFRDVHLITDYIRYMNNLIINKTCISQIGIYGRVF